ncbi:MAG: AraC family transcriptional regulator [Kiritimatiellota bacterium]|nr:AraC family transcriptional regulator [Kiritimatiellota bacterium]
MHRLMNFEVFYDVPRSVPCSDLTLAQHWVARMQDRQPEVCKIVALEAEARLRKLAMSANETKKESSAQTTLTIPTGLGHLEQMLEHIIHHYRTPLHIAEIAQTARLSRNQAMRLFRKLTGMSILKYITQHRVAHAQRLLITTDMKIVDIVYESGFSSPTRCYAAFHKYIGQSPAFYRRAMSQSHSPGCQAGAMQD